MKNSRFQSFLFVVVLAGVSLWILVEPLLNRPAPSPLPDAGVRAPVAHSSAALSPLAQDTFARWVARGAALGAQPASLTGTQVDGVLQVDAAGNLVVDQALRRVFDYFLATIGEESLEQIRARIALYLQQHLPPTAAVQAWDILNRYLHYKDMLASLPGHDGTQAGMRDSLIRQRELRDAQLGPELATAFFHEEDQYADFALQHIDQVRNPALSAEERAQQTDALLSTLPEDARVQIQATGAPLQVERQVQALRDQGASADEVWLHREQQFGADAADRLASLDQQRAEWQQRYDDYRRQLSAIATSSMADDDKAEEIARLRQEQFTPAEQKRVDALDRIAADMRADQ